MRSFFLSLAMLAVTASTAPAPANASGEVRRACLSANRPAASHDLCGCIQNVADSMFDSSDRKRIVKFFKDPHLTQELRQSGRPSDERFWEKYKRFGQVAKSNCAAG